MGKNIFGVCIIATILLMVTVYVIVRKDSTATVKENLRMAGGFTVALALEGMGYLMIS